MAKAPTRKQIVLAQVALALLVSFIGAGLAWYGFSAEVRGRIWQNLLDRPGGPMTFRFILQPIMASIMAFIDGLRDARGGSSPYLATILTDSERRYSHLREGVISTARIILLGVCMDVIYQFIEFGTFFPGEAAIIAILLAFVPYLLLRGPFARLIRRWRGIKSADDVQR
jgi:hypothetical protein